MILLAEVVTNSSDETIKLGERVGKLINEGSVLALFGELGAGKTTFTKGLAVGLDLPDDIHSPTFTLVHEHYGKMPLYHIDLYRLESEAEAETIGIEEYIESDGVTVIEWPDRLGESLPKESLIVHIKVISDDQRKFEFYSVYENKNFDDIRKLSDAAACN
ncbi:MAG: tRNA (adenosine(37)-N6)-threonylcarbamoyltransferase complex ATPase subunit type 1 TsaE [Armatimonadota bacterium]